jgi:hypothetical protein
MSYLGVASIAFDFVIGDVHSMGKFRCIFRREKIGFIMAFQALILRNVAISFIVPDVALKTPHPPLDVSLVVETYPLDQDVALWLDMA